MLDGKRDDKMYKKYRARNSSPGCRKGEKERARGVAVVVVSASRWSECKWLKADALTASWSVFGFVCFSRV